MATDSNTHPPSNRALENNTDDPFDLARFVAAQETTYHQALAEIREGRKRSHWMWYIFPQLRGLGRSAKSTLYGIGDAKEARAYLAHSVLGPRLIEISEAVLEIEEQSPLEIFGRPDDLKFHSCVTMFDLVSGPGSIFERLLRQFFDGLRNGRTVRLLGTPDGRIAT